MGNIKLKRHISFGIIAAAFVFLFNANINVLDVFPDIIGYIILSFALTKIADLNENIAVAQKYFRYMIAVEIGKIVAFMWVLGLSNIDERNTGMLLIAFSFAVIDAIILWIAVTKLFDGMISLGFAYPNTAVLSGKNEEKRSYTEKIKRSTIFFVLFKIIVMLLPEFSVLSTYEYNESSSGLVNIYDYLGLMRAMSFVVVTFAGIIWLVKIVKYFKRISRDSEFCCAINNAYKEKVLPKTSLFVRRNMKIAFFIFGIGAAFMLDFRINSYSLENFNIVPDFIGAIFFFAAFIILSEYLSVNKGAICFGSAFYIFVSTASYLWESYFFKAYSYNATNRNIEAFNTYTIMRVFSALSTVGFLIIVALIIYAFNDIIKNHTGFVYGEATKADTDRLKAYHKEIKYRLIIISAGAAILAFCELFHTFFNKDLRFTGAICVVGWIIFFAGLLKSMNDIYDEIEIKYMLD